MLASFAAELVRVRPDVIFAIGTPAAQAVKSATPTIPIVFARTGDPVGSVLAASMSRPGANLTGLSEIDPFGFGEALDGGFLGLDPQSTLALSRNPSGPAVRPDCANGPDT
jgi:putative ABC transport system substrate-binding protein